MSLAFLEVITAFEIEIDGEIFRWNVSHIWQEANKGAFGRPVRLLMKNTNPTDWSKGFISRATVESIKLNLEALHSPVLAIEAPPPAVKELLCFCDGQHRVTARRELLFPDVLSYIVPWNMERQFRI